MPGWQTADYLWEPVPDCWSVRRRQDGPGARAASLAGAAAGEWGRDVAAWRNALLSIDDAALDIVGYCTYPHGSDPEERFIDIVWWVNRELLHHGAEIALLRDLHRSQPR